MNDLVKRVRALEGSPELDALNEQLERSRRNFSVVVIQGMHDLVEYFAEEHRKASDAYYGMKYQYLNSICYEGD